MRKCAWLLMRTGPVSSRSTEMATFPPAQRASAEPSERTSTSGSIKKKSYGEIVKVCFMVVWRGVWVWVYWWY